MKPITTSIFDLFEIGPGPSSSHTIGPMKAAFQFRRSMEDLSDKELGAATNVEVRLFGSLSATGKGHGTDRAVAAGLLGWQPETCDAQALADLLARDDDTCVINIRNFSIPFGPGSIHFDNIQHSYLFNNTLIMKLAAEGRVILEKEYYSVGGGFVKCKGQPEPARPEPPYQYSNMTELKKILSLKKISLDELMLQNEKVLTGKDEGQIFQGLDKILSVMEDSVERGIHTEGVLPGPIGLARKAPTFYKKASLLQQVPDRFLVYLNAYTLATSEENAAGHLVVTAPTSGSSGVIPGLLYLIKHHLQVPQQLLQKGMLAAAAIGFIIKHNASISGAEVGCQGEIGVASSMGAALLAYANGHSIDIIENAAEIALEHHLGMTCDPVLGYVQIPCIERNAIAAVDSYNVYLLASAGDPKKQKIKLDQVVEAMLKTGRDMSTKYKETSEGGLAVCAITC